MIAYIGSSSSSHSDFGYDDCIYYPGYDDCNSHSDYDTCMVSESKEGDDEEYEESEWHDEDNEVWQPYRCRPCGVYHDARHWCDWSQPRRCYQCNLFGHLARACELWDFE